MTEIINPALVTVEHSADAVSFARDEMLAACDPLDFGRINDPKNFTPERALNENYEWLAALLNGAATRRFAEAAVVQAVVDNKCKKQFLIGAQAKFTPTTVEGTPCCVKLPEMEGRKFLAGVTDICVEDCLTSEEIFWLTQEAGSKLNNGANIAQLKGTDAYQRRLDLLRRVGVFQWAREILLGTLTEAGDGLLPFAGIYELLKKASTINLDGSNLFSALLTLDCTVRRIKGDWIALANPYAIDAIKAAIDEINEITGRTILSGVRFFDVNMFDIGNEWQSDVVLLNLDHVGYIGDNKSINPANQVIETTQTVNNDRSAGDCKVICNRIRRWGGVAKDDFNSVVRITNVAALSECLSVLGRLWNDAQGANVL